MLIVSKLQMSRHLIISHHKINENFQNSSIWRQISSNNLVVYRTIKSSIRHHKEKINHFYTVCYHIPAIGYVNDFNDDDDGLNQSTSSKKFQIFQPLSCPPAMKVLTTARNGKSQRFLLRGDSEGYVTLWNVPDITIEEVKKIQDSNTIRSKQLTIFPKLKTE